MGRPHDPRIPEQFISQPPELAQRIMSELFPGLKEDISAKAFLEMILEKDLVLPLTSKLEKAAEEMSDCEYFPLPEGLVIPDDIAGPIGCSKQRGKESKSNIAAHPDGNS